MFDDGIDIYNYLLFRHDVYLKSFVLDTNPYLQDSNYEKLRHIFQTEPIRINPTVRDITTTIFPNEYDLINLSNILSYYYQESNLHECINFLKSNFFLTENGEIINYFYDMKLETVKRVNESLKPNGYVESLGKKKLLVYKK